jgi:hypothetical protein
LIQQNTWCSWLGVKLRGRPVAGLPSRLDTEGPVEGWTALRLPVFFWITVARARTLPPTNIINMQPDKVAASEAWSNGRAEGSHNQADNALAARKQQHVPRSPANRNVRTFG